MEHVALMRKSWGLTQKILDGSKKIESRWYRTKHTPWDKIRAGDTVYFKDSGEPVTIKTSVHRVLQFSDLTPARVKEILDVYGTDDGIGQDQIPKFFEMFKDRRYCILIFLKNPSKIEPFEIDKTGFGSMASWIRVEDIGKIKHEKISI